MTKRVTIGPYWIDRLPGSKIFYVFWFDKDKYQTRRISLKTDNLVQAIKPVQEWVSRGCTGDPRSFGKPKQLYTVKEVLQAYYDDHGQSVASVDTVEAALKDFSGAFGDRAVLSLLPKDFTKHKTKLLEKHSLGTVARRFTVLRSAIKHAHDNNHIGALIKVPYIQSRAEQDAAPLKGSLATIEEIAAFIDEIVDLHLLHTVVVLLNTLSRISPILEIERPQILLPERRLLLNAEGRTQTNKFRSTIVISETLLPWVQGCGEGHLITYQGRPIKSVKGSFKTAARLAGLPETFNSYSIRHTGGRYVQGKGAPFEQSAILLGHEFTPRKKTTCRYTISPYAPNYLAEVTPLVEQFVREIASRCRRHDILNPPWAT